MSNSNGKIAAPVLVKTDTQNVLGDTTGDIGTICTLNGINKWALYKPVNLAGDYVIRNTFASFGFGADAPYATTLNAFVTLATNADNGWSYVKPTASNGFRLLDLARVVLENSSPVIKSTNGYNDDAVNPFGTFSIASNFAIGDTFTAGQTHPSSIPDTDIAVKDLADYTGIQHNLRHYGVVLVNQGSGSSYAFFNYNTLYSTSRGSEPLTVPAITLTSSNIAAGTYKAYPCMVSIAINQGATTFTIASKTATMTYPLVPVPCANGVTVTIGASISFTIDLNHTMSTETSTTKRVFADVEITQSGTTAITITNVYFKYRKSGNAYDATIETGEVANSKGSQTVPVNSGGLSLSLTDSAVVPNAIDRLWIGFEFNGTTYTSYERILVPIG